jgi:ferric-dicitrate binding protein FerR (iron transport regulator)
MKDKQLAKLMSDDSFIQWIKEDKPFNSKWHDKLINDNEFGYLVNEAEELLSEFKIRPKKICAETLNRIKDKIDKQIDIVPSYHPYYHRKSLIRYRWVAIIVFFVSIAVLIGFYTNRSIGIASGITEQVIKSTTKGQKLTVYLPDGSKVKLNFNTEICFAPYFNDTSRIVYLKGEAFFEVEKDPTRPFTVISGDISTRALGTAFNIDASSSGEKIYVTLARGKVVVTQGSSLGESKAIYLNPGEQLTFNAKTKSENVKNVDLDDVLAWTDGKIIFKNADKAEVFERLSDWYGVEFDYRENRHNTDWHYTGEFDNESLFNVLTSIGHVKKFSFQIEKDTVSIYQ